MSLLMRMNDIIKQQVQVMTCARGHLRLHSPTIATKGSHQSRLSLWQAIPNCFDSISHHITLQHQLMVDRQRRQAARYDLFLLAVLDDDMSSTTPAASYSTPATYESRQCRTKFNLLFRSPGLLPVLSLLLHLLHPHTLLVDDVLATLLPHVPS